MPSRFLIKTSYQLAKLVPERLTGFTLDLAGAGRRFCFLQYQYLHQLWAWVIGNARFALRARQMVAFRMEDKIVTTRKVGSQSCVGWVLSLFGFGELCDFILWLRLVFTAFASPEKLNLHKTQHVPGENILFCNMNSLTHTDSFHVLLFFIIIVIQA